MSPIPHLPSLSMQRPEAKYYVLKQGSKTFGVRHNGLSFVVGFRAVAHARRTQYTMHPELPPTLIRKGSVWDLPKSDSPTVIADSSNPTSKLPKAAMNFERNASLVIPKSCESDEEFSRGSNGSSYNDNNNSIRRQAMQDGNFHMVSLSQVDFFTLPFTRNVGIIIPTEILAETDSEITCLCNVLQPVYEHDALVQSLNQLMHP